MSRLFSDTVHIGLHARRLVLTRMSGGFAPRLVLRHEQAVAPRPGAAPATALLAVLETALQEARWHGAKARVLLSNTLVRYAIVPASRHIFSAAEEISLARLKFQQMHGGSTDWEVRLGNLLSGRDQIAAALERGFLQSLRDSLELARLRAGPIEPLLMRALNRVRAHISGRDFWFAQAEPGLLLLARARAGNWVSLAAVSIDAPLSRVLPAQLREAALLGDGGGLTRRVYLYAPGMDCSGCAPGADFELVDLARVRALHAAAADPVLWTGAGV